MSSEVGYQIRHFVSAAHQPPYLINEGVVEDEIVLLPDDLGLLELKTSIMSCTKRHHEWAHGMGSSFVRATQVHCISYPQNGN